MMEIGARVKWQHRGRTRFGTVAAVDGAGLLRRVPRRSRTLAYYVRTDDWRHGCPVVMNGESFSMTEVSEGEISRA